VGGKGKVYPMTGHEGQEGSRGIALLFRCTLSLTSALDGVGGECHTMDASPPGMTQYSFHSTMDGSDIGRFSSGKEIMIKL
jgi:hypothetical protein